MRPAIRLFVLMVLGLFGPVISATAQTLVPSAFTYQGVLKQNGIPYSGAADLEFRLFAFSGDTVQTGATITRNGLLIDKGVFSTTLDFGPGGVSLSTPFIEISARTPAGSANPFTVLSPRQQIMPAPLAIALEGLNRTGTVVFDRFQFSENTTFSTAASVTQSFTLSRSGEPSFIQLMLVNSSAAPITVPLTVRTNFTLLHSLSAVAPPGTNLVNFYFPPGGTLSNIATLFIDFNTTSQLGVRYSNANPFAGGTSSIGANADLYFAVAMRDNGSFTSEIPLNIDTTSAFPFQVMSSASTGATIQLLSNTLSGRTFNMTSTADGSAEGAGKFRLTALSAAAGSGLTLDSTGRTGINQTAPQAVLHVGGDARIDGAITIADAARIWSTPATAFAATNTSTTAVPSDLTVQGSTAGQSIALVAPLNLPDGATITRLRLHAIDNSATTEISCSLLATSKTSTTNTNIVSATSSSNSASVRTFDALPASPHVVNNGASAYVLRAAWITPATVNELRLRAVTIEYTVDSPLP